MVDVFELLRRRLTTIVRSNSKTGVHVFEEKMLKGETAIDTIARELTEAITPPPRNDYDKDS